MMHGHRYINPTDKLKLLYEGVFIPFSLIDHELLRPRELLVFGLIITLADGEDELAISNQTLGDMLHMSPANIAVTLKRLAERGYLESAGWNNKQRILRIKF